MKVLDLFSGSGSSSTRTTSCPRSSKALVAEPKLDADLHADIMHLYPWELLHLGPFDFIWASPPCTTFSTAAIPMGHYVHGKATSPYAEQAVELVAHTLRLIASLTPTYWVMENPSAMLRKLEVVRGIPLTEITYCQYGTAYQKPTDLFGVLPPSFVAKTCSAGDLCHEPAPRGAGYGGGLQSVPKKERALVPYQLGVELEAAMSQVSGEGSL